MYEVALRYLFSLSQPRSHQSIGTLGQELIRLCFKLVRPPPPSLSSTVAYTSYVISCRQPPRRLLQTRPICTLTGYDFVPDASYRGKSNCGKSNCGKSKLQRRVAGQTLHDVDTPINPLTSPRACAPPSPSFYLYLPCLLGLRDLIDLTLSVLCL